MALWNWEFTDRQITRDFQQFGLRPLEFGRRAAARGLRVWQRPVEGATAILTAYSPGKFDPTEARADQPVNVNGREGFFRPSVDLEDAVLTWSYADDAWATMHGRPPTPANSTSWSPSQATCGPPNAPRSGCH